MKCLLENNEVQIVKSDSTQHVLVGGSRLLGKSRPDHRASLSKCMRARIFLSVAVQTCQRCPRSERIGLIVVSDRTEWSCREAPQTAQTCSPNIKLLGAMLVHYPVSLECALFPGRTGRLVVEISFPTAVRDTQTIPSVRQYLRSTSGSQDVFLAE